MNRRKVRRYRRRIGAINAGTIVFLAVFLYVLAAFFSYLSKDRNTIFRVTSDTVSDTVKERGICIRNENVVTAPASGYVNFYIGSLSRASKKEAICSVDSTGTVYSQLAKAAETSNRSDNDIEMLLRQYHASRDGSFSRIYSLKDGIKNQVLLNSGKNMLSNLKTVITDYGGSDYFHVEYASESGIIVRNIDGLEGTSVESVTLDTFKKDTEKDTENTGSSATDNGDKVSSGQALSLSDVDRVEAGEPLYKLISDETWHIVLPLDETYYNKLKETDKANVKINNNTYTVRAYITTFEKDGAYFADLKLYNYMVNFAAERFVNVSITINSETGLKIPKTAVVKKQFYVIPKRFLVSDSKSDSNGVYRITYTKDGTKKKEFVGADVYYSYDPDNPPPDFDLENIADDKNITESVVYISADADISAGDKLITDNGGDEMIVSKMADLQGVYNVDRGYPEFERIKIMNSVDDYYLVYLNSDKGVKEYDYIIVNGKNVNFEGE